MQGFYEIISHIEIERIVRSSLDKSSLNINLTISLLRNLNPNRNIYQTRKTVKIKGVIQNLQLV